MEKADYELVAFNDEKLRLSLSALADRLNERARLIIYRTYTDQKLMSYYQGLRASGIYDHGGKSKVHREVARFPSPLVYEFVDQVMRSMYGPDWIRVDKALKHELVRPWWVISKW